MAQAWTSPGWRRGFIYTSGRDEFVVLVVVVVVVAAVASSGGRGFANGGRSMDSNHILGYLP